MTWRQVFHHQFGLWPGMAATWNAATCHNTAVSYRCRFAKTFTHAISRKAETTAKGKTKCSRLYRGGKVENGTMRKSLEP